MARVRLLSFFFLLAAGCSLQPPSSIDSSQLLAFVRNPSAMTVDATTIYVAQPLPAPLLAVPLSGGIPQTFVTTATNAVAIDGQSLYWTDGTSIFRCDTSDCAGSTVTVAADDAFILAVDATSLYWVTDPHVTAPSRVMKADKNGGAPVQLATAVFPRGLTVDAQNVYWVDAAAGLMRIPLAGGAVREIAISDSSMSGLALDDRNAYFTTVDGKLFTVAKDGGAVRTLLTDLGSGAVAVATDGRNVYVPSNGRLVKMPATGGPVTVLAPFLDYIAAIVLDATSVYAADSVSGDLVKAPK